MILKDIQAAVDRIEHIEFFRNVGNGCAISLGLTLESVRSWVEAIEMAGSNAQSNAFLEASNLYTTNLGLNFRKEYREWNRIVEEVHEAFHTKVFPRLEAAADALVEVAEIDNGIAFLKHSVTWDLVGAAVEYAYSDLVPTGFSYEILPVYEAGHFPCGWDGVWPDGKLWLY